MGGKAGDMTKVTNWRTYDMNLSPLCSCTQPTRKKSKRTLMDVTQKSRGVLRPADSERGADGQ